MTELGAYWAKSGAASVVALATTDYGLTRVEAEARLARVGVNRLRQAEGTKPRGKLLRQVESPLVLCDVVQLSAGNLVPDDCVVMEARDFLCSQSALTGESFPVERPPRRPIGEDGRNTVRPFAQAADDRRTGR